MSSEHLKPFFLAAALEKMVPLARTEVAYVGSTIHGLAPMRDWVIARAGAVKVRLILGYPANAGVPSRVIPSYAALFSLVREVTRDFRRSGVEIRLSETIPESSLLMVDGKLGFGTLPSWKSRLHEPFDEIRDPREIREMLAYFQDLWTKAEVRGETHYDLEEEIDLPHGGPSVYVIHEAFWDAVIRERELAQRPEDLLTLDPRRFEELVAELLRRKSGALSVELTPSSHDGGRDVLALFETPVGKVLSLVEAKRFAQNRPVGISIVQRLYGVVVAGRATMGMVVTTSHFSREAERFTKTIENRMTLTRYDNLVEWLRVATR